MLPRLPPYTGKTDAVRKLADTFAVPDVNPWGENVGDALDEISRRADRPAESDLKIASVSQGGCKEDLFVAAYARRLEAPMHLSTRPDCFPAAGGSNAYSPDVKLLRIPNGLFWNFAESSVVLTASGTAIVKEYSSRYTPLVHFYDVDPKAHFRDSIEVEGDAVVLCDDIRPLNFCHWLVDWLPRLAFLGAQCRRSNCYVITTPITTAFQRESLEMCGFDMARVIQVKNFQAVRARNLLITSDIRRVPHPAFKAAPWAIAYLQSTIGRAALVQSNILTTESPKKIFISRADASGRRITNENELYGVLRAAGYVRIVLSDLSFADQVALFSRATHVVAMHGAGLSHVVFFAGYATVLEIFAQTYGTPAYYVLTAGLENRHATYVTGRVVAQSRSQLDDVTIDVPNFIEVCRDYI
jgi:capsular polysaccharide biosynthesis protein